MKQIKIKWLDAELFGVTVSNWLAVGFIIVIAVELAWILLR